MARESAIKAIHETMFGLQGKLIFLQEQYSVYHDNYSAEAMELLGVAEAYNKAVSAAYENKEFDNLSDSELDEMVDLSRQVSQLYELGVDFSAADNSAQEEKQRRIKLQNDLQAAIDGYANVLQKLATGLVNSTTENSLEKIFLYDEYITSTAAKYLVEKEMIQAILFQETRFYNILDPIGDSLVVQSRTYDKQMDSYLNNESSFFPPFAVLGYRTDSSTGIGQIFAKTAITAINQWNNDTKYDVSNKKDIETIWNKLQDPEFNIDTMGAIIAMLKSKEMDIGAIFKAYNGTNKLAQKYSEVVLKYYDAFKAYNEN